MGMDNGQQLKPQVTLKVAGRTPVIVLKTMSKGEGSAERSSAQPKLAFTPVAGRICASCGASTTPLWRNGPLGPKTLCNACGVRDGRRASKKARKNNAKPKLEGKSGKGSLAATNGISKSTGGRMKKSMSAPQLHLLNSAEGGALNDAGLDAASRHRHNRQPAKKEPSRKLASGAAWHGGSDVHVTSPSSFSLPRPPSSVIMKRCRSARQISGPAPASPGAALDSNLRPWSWQERGSSLAGVGAGAHPLWEEEDDEGEEDGEEQGAGDEGVWLDWDRAVAAQLVHRPSHHAASNGGAWIVVGRGGPWGHGCHLYVVNSPPEQTVEEAMMAAREGGDADVAHVLPRPQSMHLDSELHRSSGTVVWWATHATDADTSPARAAWGLRFVSHKQYVAFKVLMQTCCEHNCKRAAAEVCIPSFVELSPNFGGAHSEHEIELRPQQQHQQLADLPYKYPTAQDPTQTGDPRVGEADYAPPAAYIRSARTATPLRNWLPGAAAPWYQADEEDLHFLTEHRNQSGTGLSELHLERLIDTFELAALELDSAAPAPEVVWDQLMQLPQISPKLEFVPSLKDLTAVHRHWLARRVVNGGTMLPRLHATSQSINDAASPNPELQAFVCGGERLEPKKPFARSMSMGDLGPRRNKCQSPASKKRDRRDRCVDDGDGWMRIQSPAWRALSMNSGSESGEDAHAHDGNATEDSDSDDEYLHSVCEAGGLGDGEGEYSMLVATMDNSGLGRPAGGRVKTDGADNGSAQGWAETEHLQPLQNFNQMGVVDMPERAQRRDSGSMMMECMYGSQQGWGLGDDDALVGFSSNGEESNLLDQLPPLWGLDDGPGSMLLHDLDNMGPSGCLGIMGGGGNAAGCEILTTSRRSRDMHPGDVKELHKSMAARPLARDEGPWDGRRKISDMLENGGTCRLSQIHTGGLSQEELGLGVGRGGDTSWGGSVRSTAGQGDQLRYLGTGHTVLQNGSAVVQPY